MNTDRAFGPFCVFILIFACCSAPKKYSYYFDHHPIDTETVKKSTAEFPVVGSPSHTPLYSSTLANEPVVFVADTPKVTKPATQEIHVYDTTDEDEPVARNKVFRSKEDRRNVAAISGFSMTIIGVLFGVWPLVMIGVIVCFFGLNGKRKWWAIAGLILASLLLIWPIINFIGSLAPVE